MIPSAQPSALELTRPWGVDQAVKRSAVEFRIVALFRHLEAHIPIKRLLLREGDRLYSAGQVFRYLYVLNTGSFKLISDSADGRSRIVGLHLRGDWLGLDGIAEQRFSCHAVALDTSAVWALDFEQLLLAGRGNPELLALLHREMSCAITQGRNTQLSLCTLSANARVAEFLHQWAAALAQRGLRTNQFKLRMSRGDIGNYLGMRLESVSRALSALVRADLIEFSDKARREILLPNLSALSDYIQAQAQTH